MSTSVIRIHACNIQAGYRFNAHDTDKDSAVYMRLIHVQVGAVFAEMLNLKTLKTSLHAHKPPISIVPTGFAPPLKRRHLQRF